MLLSTIKSKFGLLKEIHSVIEKERSLAMNNINYVRNYWYFRKEWQIKAKQVWPLFYSVSHLTFQQLRILKVHPVFYCMTNVNVKYELACMIEQNKVQQNQSQFQFLSRLFSVPSKSVAITVTCLWTKIKMDNHSSIAVECSVPCLLPIASKRWRTPKFLVKLISFINLRKLILFRLFALPIEQVQDCVCNRKHFNFKLKLLQCTKIQYIYSFYANEMSFPFFCLDNFHFAVQSERKMC